MRFTCYTQDIFAALKFAAKCAPTKPNIPILSAAKLTVDDRLLIIDTTDFNLAASVAVPVNVEKAGTAAVNAKFLLEVISKLDDSTVVFDDASGRLNIRSGAASFNIGTFDADDYPSTNFDSEAAVYIRAKALKELIRQSVFAVSKGDDRPLFTAVHLKLETDGNEPILAATATNSNRVVHTKFVVNADDGAEFDVNVPASALKILAAELPNDVEILVALGSDGHSFIAKFNNIYFKSRLMEGTFPDISRLFEPERPILANVNADEFRIALHRASLVSRDADFNAVRLCLTGNQMIVRADSDSNSVEAFVETVTNGDCALVVGFNPAYILDFLNATDGKKIQLCFASENEPAEIVDRDNLHIHYILTPINLGNRA